MNERLCTYCGLAEGHKIGCKVVVDFYTNPLPAGVHRIDNGMNNKTYYLARVCKKESDGTPYLQIASPGDVKFIDIDNKDGFSIPIEQIAMILSTVGITVSGSLTPELAGVTYFSKSDHYKNGLTKRAPE